MIKFKQFNEPTKLIHFVNSNLNVKVVAITSTYAINMIVYTLFYKDRARKVIEDDPYNM